MGSYKYIKENFQQAYKQRSDELRHRISTWRREGVVVRVDAPTNIARARELGYRAKPGVVIARVRVRKGLRKRTKPHRGRKPSKLGYFYAYRKSQQAIAEERAAREFRNCEVLNSYYVGEDGEFKFYETILLDRSNPNIVKDKAYSQIISRNNRAFRGLTSAGRKHRGLLHKGFGTTKNRPSVRANIRKIFRQ
jgi:large subunit ribosomal protein L15e